jgi:hypothetical protein
MAYPQFIPGRQGYCKPSRMLCSMWYEEVIVETLSPPPPLSAGSNSLSERRLFLSTGLRLFRRRQSSLSLAFGRSSDVGQFVSSDDCLLRPIRGDSLFIGDEWSYNAKSLHRTFRPPWRAGSSSQHRTLLGCGHRSDSRAPQ